MTISVPRFLAADFLQATLNLLPKGKAWIGDNMSLALMPLMITLERLSEQATNLLQDVFPATVGNEMIIDWQLSLGLPDACLQGAVISTDAEKAQILARFVNTGGQSVDFFLKFAADLGYPITITEGTADTFTWTVHAPLVGLHIFEMGLDSMNDFLGWFDNNLVLECEFQRLKPSYSTVIFEYS